MLGGYNYDSGGAEAEFMDKIQTKVLRVFLVAIHSHLSTALPLDIYFFKLTQSLTYFFKL
jgi:hypothetical protein